MNESINQYRYKLEKDRYNNYIDNQLKNGLLDTTFNYCACGLLIRNMKHEKINEFNEMWYSHILECGIQDQLSFFFVKQLFEGLYYPFTENPFI